MPTEPLTRRWRPGWPIDVALILRPLRHGPGDPTMRIGADGVWRATRTPDGTASMHLARVGDEVHARAWGSGAAHELHHLQDLLGARDDPSGFDAAAHPVMAAAFHRFGAAWRVPRSTRVLESLVPAILEQRVTGPEATRAWARLVGRFGDPAPGPGGLRVAPDGPGWSRVPSWAWHRAGVDPGLARTIVSAAGRGAALEALSARAPAEAVAALRTLPGIGVWTAAEVSVRAWGDADAVSFGDYHLARTVVHALTGRRDGTDDQMSELLAPWTGQRARAIRLLELHVGLPARRGPRAPTTDHRGR